jgi:hypothetical protein
VRCYLENTHHTKRAGGVAQSIGSEFKSQYLKIKQNKNMNLLFLVQSPLLSVLETSRVM